MTSSIGYLCINKERTVLAANKDRMPSELQARQQTLRKNMVSFKNPLSRGTEILTSADGQKTGAVKGALLGQRLGQLFPGPP